MKRILLMLTLGYSVMTHAEEWRTIKTDNFRVHYPAELKEWAHSASTELEIVRSKVLEQQARALPTIADVVVYDPANMANGFALPSTDSPLMALFATPPQSDTVISNQDSWQQLLILHEYIHLVHLSQPSRNKWRQKLRDLHDVSDVIMAVMPRWVAEGYATLLESRLTGRGRLHDNYSEAILRYYAQQGALLPYSKLNNGDDSYLSGSMAYILGVRFLAWLEDNYGAQTLDAVWTRAQAVKSRDFEEAFSGVFRDSPATLYKRFVAEYTYKAMQSQYQQPPKLDKLWMRFDHGARDVQLSPNKKQFLVVESSKDDEISLKVYETSEDEKAKERFLEAQEKLLEADSKDITDTAPEVFPRKHVMSLPESNHRGILHPQWLDEQHVLFVAKTRLGNGQYVNDLFQWDLETDQVTKLTEKAGLRRFTIRSDTSVIAEVAKNGVSYLADINLTTGEQQPLFTPSLGTLFDHPVMDPTHSQLAFVAKDLNQAWRLEVYDFASEQVKKLLAPEGSQFLASPTWSDDGSEIYFVAGVKGNLEVYRYQFARQQLSKWQSRQLVVRQILPQPEGLLYSFVTPQGVRINEATELNWVAVTARTDPSQVARQPALPAKLPEAEIFPEQYHSAPYDPLQQASTLTLSEQFNSASVHSLSVGLKGQDFLQTLAWQVGADLDVFDGDYAGYYAGLRYKSGQWQTKLTGNYAEIDLMDQQQSVLLGVKETSALELSTEYRWLGDKYSFTPYLSGVSLDNGVDTYNGGVIGGKGAWSYDTHASALALSATAERWLGDMEGYRYGADLHAKLWQVPIWLDVDSRYMQSGGLTLGGVNLSSNEVTRRYDMVTESMLPFSFATGRKYLGYGVATSANSKAGSPKLFYRQHQVDSEVVAQTYGVSIEMRLSLGWAEQFAPAGLSDLKLDTGLGRVESDLFENENRVWFNVWYEL
ncbi:TolB family protein [Pseudoalteromonas sp. T1lg65]|uniref:TolB family protein n=1 Tax=Pseudoalteromonas sp. T1lg65 TaxID=2077101 RepID=UPI003F79A6B2